MNIRNKNTAYLIGVALGDGNLSNPNGRAVRLRVCCDKKYPGLIKRITKSIKILLPSNKVSLVNRKNCIDISCYSNKLEPILGWKAKLGSKYKQKVSVPIWVINNPSFIRPCLKGLVETDGSVFKDRGYTHINFTTIIPSLAHDVEIMLEKIGYEYSSQYIIENKGNKKPKFVIRICKRSAKFIKEINIDKS